MTKYRILMADGNLQFQTAVRDCLAAQEQVAQFEAVADGQAAIDALRAGIMTRSSRSLLCHAWMVLNCWSG